MAVPSRLSTVADVRDALAGYGEWWDELAAAYVQRHPEALRPGADWLVRTGEADLPPRPPRLAPFDRVDADSPPVAYFAGQRVSSFRPLQAATRPRWDVRHPLATGDNGVRVKRPASALAAVVADLDHLATVAAVCGSLAVSCRAVGLTDRGALWQREADELGAFAVRHGEDAIPTLAGAFLADWRAHEARYGLPTTPDTPPSVRPVSLRA